MSIPRPTTPTTSAGPLERPGRPPPFPAAFLLPACCFPAAFLLLPADEKKGHATTSNVQKVTLKYVCDGENSAHSTL
eukprot:9072830-Lingulodinium_polyedra.AAC.1